MPLISLVSTFDRNTLSYLMFWTLIMCLFLITIGFLTSKFTIKNITSYIILLAIASYTLINQEVVDIKNKKINQIQDGQTINVDYVKISKDAVYYHDKKAKNANLSSIPYNKKTNINVELIPENQDETIIINTKSYDLEESKINKRILTGHKTNESKKIIKKNVSKVDSITIKVTEQNKEDIYQPK